MSYGVCLKMTDFHCKDCGSNLRNGFCWKCIPVSVCGSCRKPLKRDPRPPHYSIIDPDVQGRYMPYKTDKECHEHSTQWECTCKKWHEVAIFDDGRRFRYNYSFWEEF